MRLTTLICNPSRLCGIHPACLQAVIQKHLYILMLHLLVFLALASYPCTKWQDLLPEVERPGSSGLACVQQILCFTGDELMGVVRVVLWVCSWYGSLDVSPCCSMNPDVYAKCARLQHLLLRLWLYFVPNLSIYTLWVWSPANLQDHLLVPAKLAIQGRRSRLGKWDSGSYRVFLFPCPPI